MIIVVKPKKDGFIAGVKGYSEMSGEGKTPDEAVGNIIFKNQQTFKVAVNYDRCCGVTKEPHEITYAGEALTGTPRRRFGGFSGRF